MNKNLAERHNRIRVALTHTSVTLAGLTPQLSNAATELSKVFGLPFGSLIRTAVAVQQLDGEDQLTIDHLREAARHLIIIDDSQA